ncbi:hypothetical protein KGM_203703 [Danaus plexippus plexippus]|uniref:Uncharacterized protein n=1 Tax=Danaus plexippus plexippus TaxID=278856 RepID=A0A212ET57_DANPL|nr:hypothetical protein KGM_203703 [Danaus plexippus plexippus]
MEEEDEFFIIPKIENPPICKCFLSDNSDLTQSVSEEIQIPERKEQVLSTVSRTENYLRERRIPELIRFLFTQVISHAPHKPLAFLEKLLDDCMLFRAGLGVAPVLYEQRHLEAVIKSFDPGQRGWLSAGQVRRLYTTLGFTSEEYHDDRIYCDELLNNLIRVQEHDLLQLLAAGISKPE